MADTRIIHAASWATPVFQGWAIEVAGFQASADADFPVEGMLVADVAPLNGEVPGTAFLLVSSDQFVPDAPERLLHAIASAEAA